MTPFNIYYSLSMLYIYIRFQFLSFMLDYSISGNCHLIRIRNSNGGCRREEKNRKHWSLFTILLFLVAEILLFVRSNQKQFVLLIALKIKEK